VGRRQLVEGVAITANDDHVTGRQRLAGVASGPVPRLDADQREIAVVAQVEGGGGPALDVRARRHLVPGQPPVELVLLHQRAAELAEVGRECVWRALGDEPIADEHDDGDGADEQRDADQCELEEAEAAHMGLVGGVGHDHAHGRPGECQHRAGVGGERQRQQQARR
jgi:hypothetical protein